MPYRILVIHNSYRHRGGEDSVVDAEIMLLRSHGHTVETYLRNNDDVIRMSSFGLLRETLWSSRTTHDLAEKIRNYCPDIIHIHNTFPLISPSVYWAAERADVPVVQTLHNFRLMCLNALFLREGRVCEDCLGHLPWRGVAHSCYRGSSAASVVLMSMLTLHRGLGTYRNKVARYIALNDFCRSKFVEGGLPVERISVKPNFVNWDYDLPHCGQLSEEEDNRRGLLFVGRLSMEKGLSVLAKAATLLPNASLRVAGEGPEAALFDGVVGVARLGSLSSEQVRREMKRAVALVAPSIWYETFGLVVIEAFACGLPVIASRIGVLPDLVHDGLTGLLFEPGNSRDLADKMAWALAHPDIMDQMGHKARAWFESECSTEVNYRHLMEIYASVLRR